MKDQLSKIDEKILLLKQKKEKLQTQQALFFLKEVQKVLEDEFSSDLALAVLSESWSSSSETQKENWKALAMNRRESVSSFRTSPLPSQAKKRSKTTGGMQQEPPPESSPPPRETNPQTATADL